VVDQGQLGARLRAEREAHDWSREALAGRLRSVSDKALPSVESLAHMIKEWESGKHGVSDRYRRLFSKVFGMAEEDLFAAEEADDPMMSLALSRQVEATDLGMTTLDDIALVTDRLCREYPTVPAPVLRGRSEKALRYVIRLLDGRTTLQQHRELLVQAGWLAALLGCVEYDLGRRTSAEVTRRMAYRLGDQAGHGEIVGWAWEMAAWFALTEGRLKDAVDAARAGAEHSGGTNAGVQLQLQEARALARMGNDDAKQSLKTGGKLLQHLPHPEHPENHFVFDQSKYEFYTATILTWLGTDDRAAEENAREVIARSDGEWPMRAANASIDLGLIAVRRGGLDEAVHRGRQALIGERRSAQLLPRALDLHDRLAERYPKEPLVSEYKEILRAEHKAAHPTTA
jgi:transcriptional regulator with XRE-family HTH domain